MDKDPFHIAKLITAYLQDSLSPEQSKEFDKWLELEANKQFLENLTEKDNFREKLARFGGINAEATWNKTLYGLEKNKQIPQQTKITSGGTFRLFNYKWVTGAAAVITICLGIYFLNPFRKANSPGSDPKILVINDVRPGTKGAVLTLANGKTIQLSGDKNGVLINPSAITYDDGTQVDPSLQKEITKHGEPAAMLFASTANGKTYVFTLPDGTKVWLNAASSIKFPSTFSGVRREVEINGEAYLEVSKDQAHPFVVISKDQELEVLGTHFNLRRYTEENATQTTLLEGSVRITPKSSLQAPNRSVRSGIVSPSVVLKPSEQSVLAGETIKVKRVNTDRVTAWIKNDFYFRGETLQNVLQDVARWYNVKITYTSETIKSIPLIGQISRARPLSVVLERIASAGQIRFKIEGQQVTVMPDSD